MTNIPPRKAVQIVPPFENKGIWIAMYQIGDGIPYAVEVAAPNNEGKSK